ncbi:hypothetical protein AB6D11_06015 [Vibrio splendidus]
MSISLNTNEKELVGIAVESLSRHCDFAKTKDNIGFNKADTYIGHYLSTVPDGDWDENHFEYAWTILFKYQGQLNTLFGTDIKTLYKERLKELRESQKSEHLSKIRQSITGKIDIRPTVHIDDDNTEYRIFFPKKNPSQLFTRGMQACKAIVDEQDTGTTYRVKHSMGLALEQLLKHSGWVKRYRISKTAQATFTSNKNDSDQVNNLAEQAGIYSKSSTLSVISTSPLKIRFNSQYDKKAIALLSTITGYQYKKPDGFGNVVLVRDARILNSLISSHHYKIDTQSLIQNKSELLELAKKNRITFEYFECSFGARSLILKDKMRFFCLREFQQFSANTHRPENNRNHIVVPIPSPQIVKKIYRHVLSLGLNVPDDFLENCQKAIENDNGSIVYSDRYKRPAFEINQHAGKGALSFIKEHFSKRFFDKDTSTWTVYINKPVELTRIIELSNRHGLTLDKDARQKAQSKM